jgi:hypothetical protein
VIIVEVRSKIRTKFCCIALGTIAAWLQSILGNVGAHSVFAYLQSAAMGGYGAATVNGIVSYKLGG